MHLVRGVILVAVAGLGPGCGSRSELVDRIPCVTTADCAVSDLCQPVHCVAGHCEPAPPVTCDDRDPCTEDLCLPETGQCNFRPYSYDLDGDGHRGPRPGFLPGAPGACGDDCNDQAAEARPGGVERCDGLDNDCNGVVDDGAEFAPTSYPPVQVSSSALRLGSAGAMSFDGAFYGATFTGVSTKARGYFQGLTRSGSPTVGPLPLTNVGSDSYAGPLVWTGSMFATAWEDRRSHDYEIYFNRLDREGKKLGPDLRVSFGDDFSLHPDLLWNGREFMVVWDDQRDGEPRIWGQRIGLDGELLGDNVALTTDSLGESPSLVQGATRLGLVFKRGGLEEQTIAFRTVAPDFSEVGDLITVSSPGSVDPNAVFSGDRFVVVWSRYGSAGPGDAIWGATLKETGELLQSERPVTYGASFARTQSLLALGDRVLLVWAAEASDNYDLWAKLLTTDLMELTPAMALALTPGDSIGPLAAFGPDGDVGVLFDDQSSGTWQTYFSRLSCLPP